MKICSKCNLPKEDAEFNAHPVASGGLSHKCKTCTAIYTKEYRAKHPQEIAESKKNWSRNNPEAHRTMHRKWRLKNPEKIAGYSKKYQQANLGKLNEYCKKWQRANPAKVKIFTRKSNLRKHGLSLQDFDNLFSQQSGKCKICTGPLLKPTVDHCHTTGKIRGLLCSPCNVGLGMFKDSVDSLRAAIAYLQQ